ncbi:hypothetical protein DFP72DRAFT_48086 [Ephemerocybe angulata]|uniref:Uncharacterized protein n=1 Tax=Ephemerocybe angulata TaxID=980116 RepID=A0A8H6HGX8_9AGAR|nr:hypothetical protein DFP72DRAFT_48086 [Tulosesus angulatus]
MPHLAQFAKNLAMETPGSKTVYRQSNIYKDSAHSQPFGRGAKVINYTNRAQSDPSKLAASPQCMMRLLMHFVTDEASAQEYLEHVRSLMPTQVVAAPVPVPASAPVQTLEANPVTTKQKMGTMTDLLKKQEEEREKRLLAAEKRNGRSTISEPQTHHRDAPPAYVNAMATSAFGVSA